MRIAGTGAARSLPELQVQLEASYGPGSDDCLPLLSIGVFYFVDSSILVSYVILSPNLNLIRSLLTVIHWYHFPAKIMSSGTTAQVKYPNQLVSTELNHTSIPGQHLESQGTSRGGAVHPPEGK